MLLCVDIGNTNIVFALSDGEKIISKRRISTRIEMTSDELEMILLFFFKNKKQISDVIFSSVVPPLNPILKEAIFRYTGKFPTLVSPEMNLGIDILYEEIEKLGLDRIVNVVGAYYKYKKGAIIIDFGTATTFDYISSDGKYLGGAISPGLKICADALYEKAYQLPKIQIFQVPKNVIAKKTETSISAGLILGYASLVDGMIEKIRQEADDKDAITIATGGLSHVMKEACKYIDIIDDDLTIYGLITIHRLNKK